MQFNKKLLKFGMVLLIIVSVCFSPVVYADDPAGGSGVIQTMTTLVEDLLVRLTLHLGDGLLFFVSKSVGEVVTIDAIVYNGVDKLNINYWEFGRWFINKSFFW